MVQQKENSVDRIVLLDDEPSVLFALKLLMQAVGYQVTDFSKPDEALNYLKQSTIEVEGRHPPRRHSQSELPPSELPPSEVTTWNQYPHSPALGDMPVHLFVSDLNMPVMNGLAVLEEAKKIAPDVPFVLMSAHAADTERAHAKALGSFGFLAKPFSPEQLHELVNDVSAVLEQQTSESIAAGNG